MDDGSDTSATSGPSDRSETEGAAGPAARPVPPEIVIVTAVAVLAGLVLRFVVRSHLWLDEALSVNIASLPLDQLPEALRHDGHPPLYYALLHVWMQLFGSGDAAVRALSGVFAVAALPFAFLAGRRRGGPLLGALTLGLFALSPFVLRYATETRMYSLIILLVLLGYLLVDDVVARGRDSWWRIVALAVVAATLLYTHYWAMWLLAAVGALLIVIARRAPAPETRRGARRAIGAIVVGGVAFLPWLPVLWFQSRHTGTPWASPVRPTSLIANTLTDFGGGAFKDAQFVGGVLLVLMLLGLFGRALDTRRIELDLRTMPQFRAEAAVIGLTIGIGLVVSYATWSTFVTRYAATFLVFTIVLAAAGINLFTSRPVRAAVFVVTLGLFGLGCVYNLHTDRTQTAQVATEIVARSHPGDLVVYCPDQLGPSTMRLLPDGLENVAYPTFASPERIDWVDYVARNSVDPAAYARQVLDHAGPGHGVFLVWSGGYKTHEGTCESFLSSMAETRPPQTLVSEDGDTYYEHANLTYFPPASPTP